ncbi:hypothetical protein C1632_10275 [Microbacterium testaceum]|uniref:hypothetical protein n=1 Tax=Microbacterium testaceum TaxID=2033 RepID=UPI000CCEF846|nr:hypothetical protein [Microbacterium testaceum]PNW09422.1 hypothetical protein C1632_10275 [Microbacterium testaceum]
MFRCVHLAGDPIHLALQDVEGHSARVVRLHERGLFVFEGCVTSSRFTEREAGVGLTVRELLTNDAANVVDAFRREVKTQVEVLDSLLNGFDAEVLPCARRGIGSPAETGKVVVIGAELPFIPGENQAVAAVAAVDRALEVVRVPTILLACGVVRRQRIMDA